MNTLEKLQKHLAGTIEKIQDSDREYKEVAPHIECVDGSTMSVQASEHHYSEPRSNYGPYTKVEAWCCGEVPAWSDYGTGEDPYACLPIDLVVEEIDRRGGMK